MSNIPSDLKFAKSHEWVHVSGDSATVGISDHAQAELTDIVFVELPVVGRKVNAGEACAVVESVKTASDIYSPISGEIVALNQPVADNPALVNTEPYAGGWFFKIKLSNPAELNALLSPEDYKKQIGGIINGIMELNDPKWKTFNGGYRLPYDGSVRLLELDSGSNNTEKIWKEFWNELHHQGNVDLASYVVIPQLVRICIKLQFLDWNVFALVATIEECRVFRENPKLPPWLEDDYHSAIKELAEFGAKHFSKSWPKELTQSFLAVAAFAKRLPKSARLLITFSEDELDEVFEKFFQ